MGRSKQERRSHQQIGQTFELSLNAEVGSPGEIVIREGNIPHQDWRQALLLLLKQTKNRQAAHEAGVAYFKALQQQSLARI